MNIVLE